MHPVPSPMMTALRRPQVVWLALWIALLGALVPTLSHALVWAGGGTTLVEICTTTGQRWVPLATLDTASTPSDGPATGATGEPAALQLLNHCPFCLLSAERAAAPPSASLPCFAVPGRVPAPVSWFLLFLSTVGAFVPPPRGPPAFLSF